MRTNVPSPAPQHHPVNPLSHGVYLRHSEVTNAPTFSIFAYLDEGAGSADSMRAPRGTAHRSMGSEDGQRRGSERKKESEKKRSQGAE